MSSRGSLLNTTASVLGLGKSDDYRNVLSLSNLPGKMKKISGSLTNDNNQMVVNERWEWIIRYNSLIEMYLKKDSKWQVDGRVYSIESSEFIDNKRFFYRFILKAGY